ncbi:hypothetical protein FRC09_015669, partial [Ceratobasidium sp. 395]
PTYPPGLLHRDISPPAVPAKVVRVHPQLPTPITAQAEYLTHPAMPEADNRAPRSTELPRLSLAAPVKATAQYNHLHYARQNHAKLQHAPSTIIAPGS